MPERNKTDKSLPLWSLLCSSGRKGNKQVTMRQLLGKKKRYNEQEVMQGFK